MADIPKERTIKLVRDLMHIGVITCRADMPLVEAVAYFAP